MFSVYNANNQNVRIALPNKLYESIYCELPIIVAKGTYLSQLVEEWGVGVSVDHIDKKDLVTVLQKLSIEKEYYRDLSNACHAHKYILNFDFYNMQLRNAIMSLCNI